jgi:hypothetical protein
MKYFKGELGRGRKRGPKSSGNENIEERLNFLFFSSCVEVETWFAISRCLSFLMFLSAPSSSYCLLNRVRRKHKYICAYTEGHEE